MSPSSGILSTQGLRALNFAMRKLGMNVRLAGPKTLLPREVAAAYGCEVCDSVEQALEGAHVVMALRLQRERMNSGFLPSLQEYAIEFGINRHRLQRTHSDAILLHPGPVNRGIELSNDLVNSERSVILDKLRMASQFAPRFFI